MFFAVHTKECDEFWNDEYLQSTHSAAKRASEINPERENRLHSCFSGDGIMGGPIWWNTNLSEKIITKVKEGKRKAEEAGIGNGEEEDPEVTKRIAAMKEKFQKDKIAASGLD